MRDALSIMDQVIAYSNDVITLDDAIMITGGIKSEELNDWLKLIDHRDSREAFIKYHQFIEEGKDPTRLIHELVYYIRDIILMKHDGEINEDVAFAHTEDKVLYEMIDVLNDAMVMMRFSVNTSVHLEVVIVKLIQVLNRNDQSVEPQAVDLSHIEQKLAELDKKLSNYSQAPNSQAQEPQKREETQSRSSKGFSLRQIEKVLDNANKEDLVKLKDDWPKVYQHVEEKGYHALRSLIKDSEPVAASDTHVLLKFKSDLHSDLINKDEKKCQELEAVIPSIIGKDVKVVGVPDSSWLQVRHDYIQEKKANKEKKSDEDGKKPSDVAKEIFGSDVVETRS